MPASVLPDSHIAVVLWRDIEGVVVVVAIVARAVARAATAAAAVIEGAEVVLD